MASTRRAEQFEGGQGGRPPTGIGVLQYGLSEPVVRGARRDEYYRDRLDTAKSVFQLHAVKESGKVEIRRKLQRSELIPFFEKQEARIVILEACGVAHHWARMLTGLGHDVKLIAP